MILNNENFEFYALKHYNNPSCRSMNEFREDLDRIKYIKRLLNKYTSKGIMKERLLLNHIIIFYNMFGIEAASRMLWFKVEKPYHSLLKPFLLYLNLLPESDLLFGDVIMDEKIVNILREL